MFQPHRRVTTLALAALLVAGFGRAAPAGAADGMDVDESRIDALARSVSEDRATFGGLSLDGGGNLIVRYAGAAGRLAARTKLAAHTSVKVDGGRRSKVRLVEVAHSTARLDAVREQIKADTEMRAVVSRHFVDVERNTVSVGVTELTPRLRQSVKDRFGELVELHVAERGKRATRVNDSQPWVGGIRINTIMGNRCTAGYVVRSLSVFNPVRQFVTAGHCGATGSAWHNGVTSVGKMVHSEQTENGFDYGRIGGSSYYAWTYTGSPTSGTGRPVTGTDTPAVGKRYCTNGATSGEVCWGTVRATNACVFFDDTVTTCHLEMMTSDSGRVMVQPGDSGGAVITYVNDQLKVAGLIIGTGFSSGGSVRQFYFHSHNTLHPAPFSTWVVDSIP